jgi:hypothetical protein
LLVEWPLGEPEPTKYWLAFRALVDLAKMRWRVERDYLDASGTADDAQPRPSGLVAAVLAKGRVICETDAVRAR